MKTGLIHQIIDFKAAPQQIYNLIMDEKLHSIIAGGSVIMSNKVGGEFSVFDGYCTGTNLELINSEKIVQEWNFVEDGWPENHFSKCVFLITKTEEGCSLDFTQTEIPEHKVKDLSNGWNDYYWEPIKQYLLDIKN